MASVANTFVTTSAVGNREELSDVVSRITPEDTPIYSMIPKGQVRSVHPGGRRTSWRLPPRTSSRKATNTTSAPSPRRSGWNSTPDHAQDLDHLRHSEVVSGSR